MSNGASGTTIDGVEYDSNLKKGKPAEIKPDEVIRGWSEALLLMREGDKWEVTIPSGMPCLCVPCIGWWSRAAPVADGQDEDAPSRVHLSCRT